MSEPKAPAIVHSPREQWLAERKKGVGASEVAAIMGEDPRRGPLAVYADKVAGKEGEDDQSWLAFGRDVERAIANGYARKTGRVIWTPEGEDNRYEIVKHKDLGVLGATLDFKIKGSDKYPAPVPKRIGALETKAVGFHKREEWASDPPLFFVIQVQAQMACAELAWGSLGAMMGGISIAEPVDILPDKEFEALMLEAVAQFWWRVQHQEPPPVDTKPATRDAVRRLWARDDGSRVALDAESHELVREWEIADWLRGEAQSEYEYRVNQLTAKMGAHQVGVLPDGSEFILKSADVAAQKCVCGVEIKKAHVRRVPRRWWPKHLKPGRKALEG